MLTGCDFEDTPTRAGNPERRQGFIGLYHPFKGNVYSGTGVEEDEDLYAAYLFGENAILSARAYGDYPFRENIERHCCDFDVNRIMGMVLPPSENGVVNNPEDTNLWEPASPPGMIQGARRYSEISKSFPQVSGMIIDDFWANYGQSITFDDLLSIKAALMGKKVLEDGRVDHSSPATTPWMKLFVVTYEWELGSPDKSTLDLIDGTNFWIYDQEKHYRRFDEFMESLRGLYSGKEIIPGIYIHNSDYGDMSRESIYRLLKRSIDLYDEGSVSGVLMFAGHWLVKNHIDRDRSQVIDLPGILHQIYYPYLGGARGTVVDRGTGMPIAGALVSVRCRYREGGPERIATHKRTDISGSFRFSGWAGYNGARAGYVIRVEKEGYKAHEMGFRMAPKKDACLPPILLSPLTGREVADRICPDGPVHGGRQIGDLDFPRCIAIPLEGQHVWDYAEGQVLDLLRSVDYGHEEPEIWDSDDRAMKGVSALKGKLIGCPCGIALGEVPGSGRISSVIIYWTEPSRWCFWDPGSRAHTAFSCRYVVA